MGVPVPASRPASVSFASRWRVTGASRGFIQRSGVRNQLFDLTSLQPALEKQRREIRLAVLALAAVFAVLAALNYALCPPGAAGITPLQLFVILMFLGLFAASLGFALAVPLFWADPTTATIDAEGLHLSYRPARVRSFPWGMSKWWFMLNDWREQIRTGKYLHFPAPFSLNRAGFQEVWLTEEAGEALLKGAKAAGVNLKSRVVAMPRRGEWPRVYTDEKSLYR